MRIPFSSCAPALAAWLIAGPVAAQTTYYVWQTDEGAHAFTDDAKAIPEAYRAQAQRRALRPLAGYAQLTPSDARATSDYAARLGARLAHLRELNERPQTERPARASSGTAPGITLRTGGDESPVLEITPVGGPEDEEPVIVETLRAHPADRLVTRNNVVVRRGDRTLAIVRSRGREWNVNEDLHIEEDLE
jgi:hypothetical protein